MYGKVFQQIYKGTLAMVGPWEALVTFQQFIVLANKHGEVDMTADAISRETTIPLSIIQKGIKALQSPDPESRSPDEDGRRIVLLNGTRSWGWRVVNYERYRKIQSDEDRRLYHQEYYLTKTKPKLQAAKGKASTGIQQIQTESTDSSDSRQVEVEVEVEVTKKATKKPVANPKDVQGLNLDAWGKWASYRSASRLKKYTTNQIATRLAKLPHDMQMVCVDASIDQAYSGIFPESFTGRKMGNGTGNETYHEKMARELKAKKAISAD